MLKAKATTKTWDPDAKAWTISEEWEINIPENDEEREQLCDFTQVIYGDHILHGEDTK